MRKRKKMSQIDKLNYLQRLAMEVSGVGLLEREPNRPQVFTSWSPHIEWMEIEIYPTGWDNDNYWGGLQFRLETEKNIRKRFKDGEIQDVVCSEWDEQTYIKIVRLLEKLKKQWYKKGENK